jgi:hypothetical protein
MIHPDELRMRRWIKPSVLAGKMPVRSPAAALGGWLSGTVTVLAAIV